MILKYAGLGLLSATLHCGSAFAQDDLFTIDKSEVQPSWNDEGLDTEVSKIAIPSLLNGRKAPIITQASFDQFETENTTLLPRSSAGVTRATAQRLISMAFQAHVRTAVSPAWFEIYYPNGNIKDLSAFPPEKRHGSSGYLRGKGFTPDGYFVADHVVHDVTYARYYFELVKDGRTYFQPINNIDPVKKTVTLWQKVKTNIDADAQFEVVRARVERERQQKEQLEQERRRLEAEAKQKENSRSSAPVSSYSAPTPKFFTGDFGPAPLSKEMQEIVDAGKGQVEGIYETQRQCRLVEDNDSVFIRSKKVCEDVQVLVGTRPVR